MFLRTLCNHLLSEQWFPLYVENEFTENLYCHVSILFQYILFSYCIRYLAIQLVVRGLPIVLTHVHTIHMCLYVIYIFSYIVAISTVTSRCQAIFSYSFLNIRDSSTYYLCSTWTTLSSFVRRKKKQKTKRNIKVGI